MSVKRYFMIILLLGALALVACGGAPDTEPGAAPGDTPTEAPEATETPEEAEQVGAEALPAAQEALADFLGVDAESLEMEKIEDAEWPDGCLGLGQPDEGCLAAITPGYAITFNVDGESYVVRTDLDGNAVRVEAAYEEMGEAVPDAAQAALQQIAAETGVTAGEIEVVSVSAEEWSDSCLGLGGPDESCAAVITPGYLVVLRAGDQEFNVRTDETGSAIRVQETADPETELPASAEAAREALAEELGASIEEIEVINFERMEWTDSCLGLGGPAESCAAVITPGWQVMLDVAGTVYEVRTDETGDVVRVAGPGAGEAGGEAPAPDMGDAVIFYQRSGGIAGEVVTVRIYEDGTVERSTGRGIESDATEGFTAERAAVEQLLTELEATGYYELERSYVPRDTCCDRILHLLTVQRDGETHTIEALGGTDDTPQAVWDSIEVVESFVEEATE